MDETTQRVPSAEEVVSALAGEMRGHDGPVDRLTLERATDHHYMVRVYGQRDDHEYEAYQVQLEPDDPFGDRTSFR